MADLPANLTKKGDAITDVMEIVFINCKNCGGPVKITPETESGNCEYCGSYFFSRKPTLKKVGVSNDYTLEQIKKMPMNEYAAMFEFVNNHPRLVAAASLLAYIHLLR